MPLDSEIREKWEKLQEAYSYPIDAIGRPIEPTDENALTIWLEEGIDGFMKS